MYLHLGQNTVILTKDIVGIFDLDNTTLMKASREYLAKAEKSGEAVTVSFELPKSFVVCVNQKGERKVYISQLSSQTLIKRARFIKKINK
ncbi:MAG: extracellular matrix regulator RemB [Acutalibacteraceae bacterium]